MKVCYFGIKDANYPRQSSISKFLDAQPGVHVDRVFIDPSEGFRRNAGTLIRFAVRCKEEYDVIFLAEFSLQFAFIATFFARRMKALLVVDWFVGLYETRVEDYASHNRWSLKALAYSCVDRFAARTADLVITDTDIRARMLEEKYHLGSRPRSVPVGAPAWAEYRNDKSDSDCFRVLYYGNYIPLHGLDRVIPAVIAASTRINLRMTLIGNGAELSRVSAMVKAAPRSDLFEFLPPVKESSLVDYISNSDVVLGVFGSSQKARTVIANKVWQGLACGTVVLTQTSLAVESIRSSFPELLFECDRDPDAIESALVHIAGLPRPSENARLEAATITAGMVSAGLVDMFDAVEELLGNKNGEDVRTDQWRSL